MGWEKRGNSEYYYQKQRISGRVRSVYVGRGEAALLISQLDNIEFENRQWLTFKAHCDKAEIEKTDHLIDEVSEINKLLVDALFLINGYHQHKRQWRKKRNGSK